MKAKKWLGMALAFAGALVVSVGTEVSAQDAAIAEGLSFTVADGYVGSAGEGTHFHSNQQGEFDTPPGKAEVGSLFEEEVRGLAEYDLTGMEQQEAVFVTFTVYAESGLFAPDNGFPFVGNIAVVAYAGNNAEDLSDFQATPLGEVTTFSTAGLTEGSVLSLDITEIYNEAIARGLPSLGIRLQVAPGTETGGGAWTFDNFLAHPGRSHHWELRPLPPILSLIARMQLTVSISFCSFLQRKLWRIFLQSFPDDGTGLGSSHFRPLFQSNIIAAGAYTRETGEAMLAEGKVDAIAYGRLFIANPDLPQRFALNAPLNAYDRATFYGGDTRGYTDYPFLEPLEKTA
ncbi:MAG: hypothetical protein HC925_00970 [Coleofasciculaceae cyanobacterium SM2_3_26]|nr:hypothetical protein [Coleofasciculaceae cyanobacterium SM2_3_26]